jgi:hypothetical protein
MAPPLAVHSDASPIVNNRWEKLPLSLEDLLERIKVLKQQGLTDFGIMASFLHHQVQPLNTRESYGFEYVGAEDPSRMIPTQELMEEEVLGCLRKILKDVSVAPL